MPSMSAVEWHETLIIGRLSPELGTRCDNYTGHGRDGITRILTPHWCYQNCNENSDTTTFIAQPPAQQ